MNPDPVESIVVRYDDGDYAVPYRPEESMSDTADQYSEGHAWYGACTDYSAAMYPEDGCQD